MAHHQIASMDGTITSVFITNSCTCSNLSFIASWVCLRSTHGPLFYYIKSTCSVFWVYEAIQRELWTHNIHIRHLLSSGIHAGHPVHVQMSGPRTTDSLLHLETRMKCFCVSTSLFNSLFTCRVYVHFLMFSYVLSVSFLTAYYIHLHSVWFYTTQMCSQ